MMLNCEYEAPACKTEALQLLAEKNETANLRIYAGGTDLLRRVRGNFEPNSTIIDISRLGLNYIKEEGDCIRVGAMATLSHVQSIFLRQPEPLHLQSISSGWVGCWQTRNVATLAGNVCAGLPSADATVTLLCLEAKVQTESVRGERIIPVDEFFVRPRKLALEPDELVTEIIIPKQSASNGSRFGSEFEKIGRRKEMFISVLSIGCVLLIGTDGTIEKARLACGVLAPIPIRLYRTEEFFASKKLTDDVIAHAGDLMRDEIKPRDSYRSSRKYRENAGVNVMKRVVLRSAERAKEV